MLIKEEINTNRTSQWIKVNSTEGKFEYNGELYSAISGDLLGFGKHQLNYQNEIRNLFDIYIEGGNEIHQLQIGLNTETAWKLLNMLVSKDYRVGDLVLLRASKDDNGYLNISVQIDNEYLKWKVKWNEAFNNLDFNQRIEKRNAMINKWADYLISKYPYGKQVEIIETVVNDTVDINNDDVPF